MPAETKHVADHVHLWVIPLNFPASLAIPMKSQPGLLVVFGSEFNDDYELGCNIGILTKAVFESEISKFRQDVKGAED